MSDCLGVIGCGKMAYAILKGLWGTMKFADIYINDIDPERINLFEKEFTGKYVHLGELVNFSNIIILAVKPQQVAQVMMATKGLWGPDKLLISVAAGIKTTALEELAAENLPVVRVMPNTPCLIGEGVSAVTAGTYAIKSQAELVWEMFGKIGYAAIVEEKYLDAITALSGSGPGYVFLVAEAMINAGVLVGLDNKLARELVLKTIKGSISMLTDSSEHPAVLRDQVCSPAGTTIAGVRELEANGIRKAFYDAVNSAYKRSIELGKD